MPAGEHRPDHRACVARADAGTCCRFDREAIRLDPRWAPGDLNLLEAICYANEVGSTPSRS